MLADRMKPYLLHLLFLVLSVGASVGAEVTRKLDDFDEPFALSDRWVTVGSARATKVAVPEGGLPDGVSYKALKVNGGQGAVFAVRANFPRPSWWKGDRFRFWASAPGANPGRPLVLAVEFYARERKAYFRREVKLTGADWRLVEIPLRFVSPGLGKLKWEECHRFAFRFLTPGSVQIDAIELVETDRRRPTEVKAEEIGKLAFGDAARSMSHARFELFTDQPGHDLKPVLAELEKTYIAFSKDFPALPPPPRPVPVLLFGEPADYLAFWTSLAEQYGKTAAAPRSEAHSLLGAAGASLGSDGKSPVKLSTELARLLLASGYGLSDTGGDWLSEGLASHYEYAAKDENLHELTKRALVAGKFLPLSRLLDGKAFPRDYAPQVALFVKYLLEHPSRRDAFDRAIRYMAATGSLNFAAASQAKFGATLRLLEDAWLKWCRKRVGLR